MKKVKELIVYVVGMAILGLGLSLSTKFDLGTSAITALPFSISEIYNISFGNITLIYYLLYIIAQVVIHIVTKKYKMIFIDIIQVIVSIIFTRYLDIVKNIIPSFADLNIFVRIIIYLVPVVLVGIGALLTIKTNYPQNPPDGFIKTMAEVTKKDAGLIKNIVDIAVVIITCIFSYIVCHKIIGVGIGTVIAMLLVGRVMHLFDKIIGKKINFK